MQDMTEMILKLILAQWVKNYTMAHLKLCELANARCQVNCGNCRKWQ